MVANAAGDACVCRAGLVLRGRSCVDPAEHQPKKRERDKHIKCLEGMVAIGETCVRKGGARMPSDFFRGNPGGGHGNPGGPGGSPRGR